MEIDGNLVIRWRERGSVDLSFVPTGPPPATPVPIRRLDSAADLRTLLADLGLPPDRVAQLAGSLYVLHSLPARVDRRVARRLGLVTATSPARWARDRLIRAVVAARRRLRRLGLPPPRERLP